jgi:hypothetical protein
MNFDKIYVIQSLNSKSGDKLTGRQLYDEVIQFFPLRYPDKRVEFYDVDTADEFLKTLDLIYDECMCSKFKPIIHFEVHGLSSRFGLALNSGQVSWPEIYPKLAAINIASGWNLFVTMAVCFGNYAMMLINPIHPAPFKAIIGSFDEVGEEDLYIGYNSFYAELLNSLDVSAALDALKAEFSNLNVLRLIDSEQTFKNVYRQYLDNQFTDENINKRFNVTVKKRNLQFKSDGIKNIFYQELRERLLESREELFNKHKNSFFMFDTFPENREIYCKDWMPNFS